MVADLPHPVKEKTHPEKLSLQASNVFIPAGEPTVGFLFLTRGDVNQPGIWREYLASAGDRARVYAHSKNPETLPPDSFLLDRQVSNRVTTAWGSISLVEATLAMMSEALEDSEITHFVPGVGKLCAGPVFFPSPAASASIRGHAWP